MLPHRATLSSCHRVEGPQPRHLALQKAGLNPLAKLFAGCPDNAFQKVQPGMMPFTLGQRLGAPLRNGLKLFGVGFGASLFGVAITNTLIGLRSALDPTFVPLNQAQDILATSLAYGTYMATSSNLRYQVQYQRLPPHCAHRR